MHANRCSKRKVDFFRPVVGRGRAGAAGGVAHAGDKGADGGAACLGIHGFEEALGVQAGGAVR
jgi:hypothetical protein